MLIFIQKKKKELFLSFIYLIFGQKLWQIKFTFYQLKHNKMESKNKKNFDIQLKIF